MTTPRRVLLAPAASPRIGGGHVLRALALSEALAERGAACTLAVNAYGASLAARFGGCAAVYVREGDTPAALRNAVAARAPQVLVLDDYAADAGWIEALGPARPHVAVIDDLADRRHLCNLLVDPGYGRGVADYAALTPPGCQVLTGPAYALLRPGFAPRAGRPGSQVAIERVFVSLGLSDVGGVTARVVKRVRALSPQAHIDVAAAADAPSVAPLRARAEADPRLKLHLDVRDVGALMREAEAAVGAGGASTWERCAVGLPSLAVIVADNQRRVTRALEADGVLLACDLHAPGFGRAFDDAWRRLQDRHLRATLAARATALCDGRGAGRVADAILQL